MAGVDFLFLETHDRVRGMSSLVENFTPISGGDRALPNTLFEADDVLQYFSGHYGRYRAIRLFIHNKQGGMWSKTETKISKK